MSSIDLSDDVYSSEDEDVILANMETRSGLPHKHHGSGHSQDNSRKTMQTDTAVATVKMSGVVMKQGVSIYDTDSEDEEIMRSLTENFNKSTERTDSNVSKKSKHSSESNMSNKTLKSANSVNSVSVNSDHTNESPKQSVMNGHLSTKGGKDESFTKSDNFSDSSPSRYKDERFNPFDRDLHIDEDHFEKGNRPSLKTHTGRLKSGKFLFRF